ncbi:PBP1A family penicillin-binding protein [bacterium]|nr:PBP1A family penicillin-binding protein [bacterium]
MKRLKRIVMILSIGLLAILLVHTLTLYHTITKKFEHHRWNLPSRVFSDSYSLYNGRYVKSTDIDEKLDFLEYNEVSQTPKSPGEFYKQGNNYEVYLHNFNYPHQKFEGYPISFAITDGNLSGLKRIDTEEELTLARLEPEVIASIFDENLEDRTFVPFANIPQALKDAIVSVEDERFYKHYGIDFRGITRAMFKNIIHFKLKEGGSTLTQQLVKNFFLTPKRTLSRKFNEMIMAFLLEARYSKDEIFEAYLNEIYLGQRGPASVAGVEEAANLYFSKNVSQLNIAESALLAGIIRSPGYYSPFDHPDRALRRRNLILGKMLENSFISKDEHDAAVKESLPLTKRNKRVNFAPHFVDLVLYQLKENFPRVQLEAEGLYIFTTLDMNEQRKAYRLVEKSLASLEKNSTVLKKNKDAGVMLQGALIMLQNATGYIRAYVGGRDYIKNQFDHLLLSKRQPGSLMKPFVYMMALDPEQTNPPKTLATLIDDSPLEVDNDGEPWKPQNYDKTFHGMIPLREALEKSFNVAAVRLSLEVGLDKIVKELEKFHFVSEFKPYPSLVLGSFEVSPMEMIRAYTVFPNQGVLSEPQAIRQVVTPDGEVLERKDLNMEKVISPDTAFLVNQLLTGVFDRGTAKGARNLGFTALAAGKTGTTSGYRDAWFVGYTPDVIALTWVGYDDGRATGLTGGSGALPLWSNFMKEVVADNGSLPFRPTPHIILVPIDPKTGLIHRKKCGEALDEYFIKGTEPTEDCK